MRTPAVLISVLFACVSLASGQIDIRSKQLAGADLRRADLRRAELRDANLHDADLERADLSDADLRGADLRGADLRGANLRRVKNPPDCEEVADLESFCAALRKSRP